MTHYGTAPKFRIDVDIHNTAASPVKVLRPMVSNRMKGGAQSFKD